MPFSRPTLSDLRRQVASDIASSVPGSDPLLRIANLKVTGDVQAGLAHLHYGYLDWIAKQAVPYTASGEFLEAWGAFKNVYRKAATAASGSVTFSGAVGATIPSGSTVVRGDGETYATQSAVVVGSGGTAVAAVVDSTAGASGNCVSGTAMTLGSAITGVQSIGAASTAIAGGADAEADDDFYARVLGAFQSVPQGGAGNDYVTWALQVPGVTRAWFNGSGFGAGTVVVYAMLDDAESAHNGFPQGVNGVATNETRGTPTATGDQLIIANYLYALQPVTALVYVCAPTAAPQNFTISGLSSATTATRSAIAAAIANVFAQYGTPKGGMVALSYIESAIAAIPGTAGFVITVPAGNITTTIGQLPTVGTISYV